MKGSADGVDATPAHIVEVDPEFIADGGRIRQMLTDCAIDHEALLRQTVPVRPPCAGVAA
jgi:hypothetical protein